MAKVVDAIYKKGVFKPIGKVNLKDGEKVRITISRKTSRGMLDSIEKYVIKSDLDLTSILVEERR